MTDRWSPYAQAYRDSDAHRQGPDLDLLGGWAEGKTALDVAAGGGNLARRLREAGFDVVTVDPSPGMQADVIARAEHLPFAEDSFDTVASRIAPHHFEDVALAMRELARVARRVVLVSDLRYLDETGEEAERLRDPTHVRSYSEDEWRALFEQAGLRVEAIEMFDVEIELEPWLERAGCEGEEASRVRALLADRISDGRLRLPRIALKGRT
jgi:ubiquinone/menaquinone biosynthesis C-methylase UbiE